MTDPEPTWNVPHASTIRCLYAAIDRIRAGDEPAEIFRDFGWQFDADAQTESALAQPHSQFANSERFDSAAQNAAAPKLDANLEPLAYIYQVRFTDRSDRADREWHYYGLYRSRKQVEAILERTTDDDIEGRIVPLYTAPQQRQPLPSDGIHTCHADCQRPACVAVREAVAAERDRMTRKPLTDEQIGLLVGTMQQTNKSAHWLARAVEQVHRIGGVDE